MIGEFSGAGPDIGVEHNRAEQPGGPSPEMRRQMEAAKQRLTKYHTVYRQPELGGPPSGPVSQSEEP
jgi:hypothetical protein